MRPGEWERVAQYFVENAELLPKCLPLIREAHNAVALAEKKMGQLMELVREAAELRAEEVVDGGEEKVGQSLRTEDEGDEELVKRKKKKKSKKRKYEDEEAEEEYKVEEVDDGVGKVEEAGGAEGVDEKGGEDLSNVLLLNTVSGDPGAENRAPPEPPSEPFGSPQQPSPSKRLKVFQGEGEQSAPPFALPPFPPPLFAPPPFTPPPFRVIPSARLLDRPFDGPAEPNSRSPSAPSAARQQPPPLPTLINSKLWRVYFRFDREVDNEKMIKEADIAAVIRAEYPLALFEVTRLVRDSLRLCGELSFENYQLAARISEVGFELSGLKGEFTFSRFPPWSRFAQPECGDNKRFVYSPEGPYDRGPQANPPAEPYWQPGGQIPQSGPYPTASQPPRPNQQKPNWNGRQHEGLSQKQRKGNKERKGDWWNQKQRENQEKGKPIKEWERKHREFVKKKRKEKMQRKQQQRNKDPDL